MLPETWYINELTLTGLEVSVLPSVVDRVAGGEVGAVSGVDMATLVVITTTEGAVTTGVEERLGAAVEKIALEEGMDSPGVAEADIMTDEETIEVESGVGLGVGLGNMDSEVGPSISSAMLVIIMRTLSIVGVATMLVDATSLSTTEDWATAMPVQSDITRIPTQ